MSPNLASTAEAIAGALLAGGALWLVARIYHAVRHREGLGGGDIRMVAMMGAFLGVEGVLLALIVGSLLGSVVGLAYILLTSKDAGSYELPFGTFLGVGALVLGLFGGSILSWYAHF
jgi:leader peptidase (prepilin peptidase)/N-methyltransferase